MVSPLGNLSICSLVELILEVIVFLFWQNAPALFLEILFIKEAFIFTDYWLWLVSPMFTSAG
jgi:hypothetical protein